MKIGFLVPGFSRDPDDWAIPALQTLACHLAGQHEVHLFSLRYPVTGHYSFCGLTHHATGGGERAGARSLAIVGRTVRAVLAEHRRAPFDLLHAFWVDEPAFAAVIAGTRLRRPVIASVGGGELVYLPVIGYGTWGSRWRRPMIRLALARSSLVTAGSPFVRRLLLGRGVAPQKVVVAPLGVDPARFRPGPAPERRPLTIVQAASLTPVKNQHLLLDVLARIRRHRPGARLLVAGDGPLREALRRETGQRGLTRVVEWQGALTHPEMAAFYRQGDLYLQTSLYESQGMAVLEARACGLPALGTPVGLLPELAALPASADPGRLAEQILSLSEQLRGKLIRPARLERTYHIVEAATRFLDVYHQLAQGRIPVPPLERQ